jgi:hypothetical protein
VALSPRANYITHKIQHSRKIEIKLKITDDECRAPGGEINRRKRIEAVEEREVVGENLLQCHFLTKNPA